MTCSSHRFLILAGFLACFLPATLAQAQACDPFTATFKQELWPHSANDIPVYFLASSTGCPSFPGPVHCLSTITLPADAGVTTPAEALQFKCESLVAQIASSCPRFTISNVDCDPTPGQMTQFDVTDSLCQGETVPAGDGLALLAANELTALSSFTSGTILTDYERDTVIPHCPAEASNGVVIAGNGGSGTAIFPGGSAAFEVLVTTAQSGTISHSEPTFGVGPAAMASAQAVVLNNTMLAIGDPVRCSANGRVLTCSNSSPQAFAPGDQPTLTHATNDPAMPAAAAGGASNGVAAMLGAVANGGCENLANDCAALGTNLSAPSVPALGMWGGAATLISLLAVGRWARKRA
jgi:hypothetical protein